MPTVTTDRHWTSDSLKELIKSKLKDTLLIVVSNREPFIHNYKGGKIEVIRPASGLVTALDPVMEACGGIWIAHGAGSADKAVVDKNNKIKVPPENPKYELKRVWLTKEQETGYYYGFSNETLWPMSHIAHIRPSFKQSDWEHYKTVNQIFAKAILEEIKDKEKVFIWIQDYHLSLVPKIIKKERPDARVAQFWHIPWPSPESFAICPWKIELLEGLLGNDLLGFHIRRHCDNFLACVADELEAKINKEYSRITYSGIIKKHNTFVLPFPISVDIDQISKDVQENISEKIAEDYGLKEKTVALGVDRLDYTKGIIERLTAVDRFLEKYPQYHRKFIFVEAGALSRIQIEHYKLLNDALTRLATHINWKYGSEDWQPITLMKKHLSYQELLGFYNLADMCLVSSLHDGMNLVAKEYISAKSNSKGVLILSKFTGAARELSQSLFVNPYDTEDFAEKIKQAIEMADKEKVKRMKKLKNTISENNIYKWAGKFINRLIKTT